MDRGRRQRFALPCVLFVFVAIATKENMMSTKIMPGLYYTDDDEWLLVEGDTGIVGVTDYAQDSLSDIVFLELPGVGSSFGQGESFGVVESVKAASDLLMPVAGKVTAVNEGLVDTPDAVNEHPFESWMVKIAISDLSQLAGLMDAEAYAAYCAERDLG
jgi:glycine cleavage system H protein